MAASGVAALHLHATTSRRDPNQPARGTRGGAASRMSGSEKRKAREEREKLLLSTTLAD